jgi:hypothetical protein
MKDESAHIYRARRVELSYEVSFGSPAFDLPSKNVQLLRALYEAINPRFPINISSMQAQGGNTLGDVKVRVFLFNNSAFLDIDLQRMLGTFTNIMTRDDVEVVKDCLLLAEDAWKRTFPEIDFRQSCFDLRFHLELDGGRASALAIIGRLMKPLSPIDIGAKYQGTALVMNYEHQEEKWRVNLMLDESQLVPEGLFIHLRAFYDCDGEFKSFQGQEAHLITIFEKFFRGLNLRAAEQ